MGILSQFLLRLAFGLAAGMLAVAGQKVTSGYFRNHLYVTLGLTTLAALVSGGLSNPTTWLAALAALLSYVGAVCWLYEARRAGSVVLGLVALAALLAAWANLGSSPESPAIGTSGAANAEVASLPAPWHALATITSGLVLGTTIAAMLLGHWYLNSPDMELAPLYRLLAVAGVAVAVHAVVCVAGLTMEYSARPASSTTWLLFVVLRWAFGLIGVAGLLWMARETLKVPNTQSATGILYVAVIGVFVGELMAMLLSAESTYPL